MKLKTLKELMPNIYTSDGSVIKSAEGLRTEAKKWVESIAEGEEINLKTLKVKSNLCDKYEVEYQSNNNMLLTEGEKAAVIQIAWIKHFFNLEEQ